MISGPGSPTRNSGCRPNPIAWDSASPAPKLIRSRTEDLLSSAVAPGTVQVPPDGRPIILMADAQTIGGYPQVAHVIGPDLPLAAQLRPGDRVRFCEIALDEAHRLALARERELAHLRAGLQL